MHLPRCRCSCRSARRSAPRSPPHGTDKTDRQPELAHERARLCRAGAKILGAGQAATDCDRRTLRHRKVVARARIGARIFRHCRARSCCAAMSSARRCLGSDETDRLPERAYSVETTARVYSRACGKGAARDGRRLFGHRRRGLRAAGRADRRSRNPQTAPRSRACSSPPVSRPVSPASASRSGDASDADTIVARKQEDFDLGHITWSKVDASGTPEETLLRAEAMLGLK